MGIFKIIVKGFMNSIDNELFELSGYAAYTTLLAFFPFLILVIAVASLFGQVEQVQELIFNIELHLPEEVNEVLIPIIRSIFESPVTRLITFSILGILWASSCGIESIRLGLNRAYEVKETRSFFLRHGQNLILIFILSTIIVVSSFILIIVPMLVSYLPDLEVEFQLITTIASFDMVNWMDFLAMSGLLALLFCACYYLLPNHQKSITKILPGAIFSAFLCIAFSNIFSLIIQNFTRYNAIYKALAGVLILLLFVQISIYIFLLGAQFNRELVRAKLF